jgi:hypothetical protein
MARTTTALKKHYAMMYSLRTYPEHSHSGDTIAAVVGTGMSHGGQRRSPGSSHRRLSRSATSSTTTPARTRAIKTNAAAAFTLAV